MIAARTPRALVGLLAGALVLALGACGATLKNNPDVCPEYRDLRCAGSPICTQDSARKCDVCQCEDATTTNQTPTDPALPPEKREPFDPSE